MSVEQRKRVNIRDVARLAGVSPTTVSHALGGQRPVSERTRKRVQEAVAQLGYRPHPGARSLKASGTGVIALCAVSATSNAPSYADLEYLFRLIRGVTEAAYAHEYALVVVPDSRGAYWDRLLLDGAVVSDPQAGDANLRSLRRQGLPYVTIGRDPDHPDEGYWVADDAETGSRLVLDHLLRRGARDIAVVTWPTTDHWTRATLLTYLAWCGEHGFEPRVEDIGDGDEEEALEAAAQRLLGGPRRPDAVYVLYELPAIAVLRKAAELGIDVPGELMVAGPNDFGLAEKREPPMTTLDYDAERHGREAADMLIRLVRGEHIEAPRRLLPVSLVERESTRR